MAEKKHTIKVSASLGSVSAKVIEAKKPRAVLVLAHGAGAGMDHAFMISLSEALAEVDITTVRYNFPYMEHKRGRPDSPATAMKTVEAAAVKAAELFPRLPLLVGGKSFGGRMSSHWVSAANPPNVKGLVFFGFPLHRPGAPSIERAEHLYAITVPMLFLQGTRDTLADLVSLKKVCKKLKQSTLVTFEGADHSFKSAKEYLVPKLAETVSKWMST